MPQSDHAEKYLAPMDRYKGEVVNLFPGLHQRIVNNCSIFPIDAVALGCFLEHYPRKAVALEIGAFVGISTFCLASHQNVSKVISVDPNPVISDELAANTDRWAGQLDFEPLKDLKVFDVASAVLQEFDEERAKIERREGVVGSTIVGAKGGTIPGLQRVGVPVADRADGEGLVALVDGLHTREGVRADLAAVFKSNPRAVALLDDCRYGWGYLVQAGVEAFMEEADERYHFRLFADFAPGLAKSSFGIVYPESVAGETDEVLGSIREEFRDWPKSERLLKWEEKLTRQLEQAQKREENRAHQLERTQKREEKLTRQLEQAQSNAARFESRVSSLQEQLSKARERNTRIQGRVRRLGKQKEQLESQKEQLEERREQLETHYSKRRYKIADALAGAASRVPGLRRLF